MSIPYIARPVCVQCGERMVWATWYWKCPKCKDYRNHADFMRSREAQ